MRGCKELLEAEGRSHAELTAGLQTVEKLLTVPAKGVALLTAGREGCRASAVPRKGAFWELSVGRKGTMKHG